MRVLQVHTRYRSPGGEDRVADAELELLREAGHSVLRHEATNPEGRMRAAGTLAVSMWNPHAARSMRRTLDDFKPDVVHVHNTWFAMSPSVVDTAARRGTPVVATLHNYRLLCSNAQLFRDGHPCEDCVGTTPWSGVRHRCYRGSVTASAVSAAAIAAARATRTWSRRVDLFIALSEFARDLFVAGGLPASRIVVRPNFATDPGARTSPPSTSKTVVMLGRLSEEKGPELALRAWAKAAPPGLELLVIGDGPLRRGLEALGVPGARFAGQIAPEDVASALLSSRALLFPSRWYEGQPLALVEAMSCGLPVIASAIGGVGEMLGEDDWGISVVGDDPDAWAAELPRLGDGAALDRSGERARSRYLRHHTPGSALSSLQASYERASYRHIGPGT